MCDTIVALPPATAAGSVLFGKNSDRERNEAQVVEFLPRARHAPAPQRDQSGANGPGKRLPAVTTRTAGHLPVARE